MSKPDITAERARQVLDYEVKTGIFTWRVHTRNTKVGQQAGTLKARGYVVISIGRKLTAAHRLAWLFYYGVWPTFGIDHINGNRSDNRICNLRDFPQSYNLQNQRQARKDSKSGFLGVSPNRSKWAASIHINGVKTHLGTFDSMEEAHLAYLSAKRRLHIGCSI